MALNNAMFNSTWAPELTRYFWYVQYEIKISIEQNGVSEGGRVDGLDPEPDRGLQDVVGTPPSYPRHDSYIHMYIYIYIHIDR